MRYKTYTANNSMGPNVGSSIHLWDYTAFLYALDAVVLGQTKIRGNSETHGKSKTFGKSKTYGKQNLRPSENKF